MKKSHLLPFIGRNSLVPACLFCFVLLLCNASFVSCLSAAGMSAFTQDSYTVVLWSLSEGEGDEFLDQGPSGINLKVSPMSSSQPSWTDGKFGKALSFPGNVILGPRESGRPPDFSGGEMTVEAWIKPSVNGEGREMAILQLGFRLTILPKGEVCLLISDGSREVALKSSERLSYGEWSHVAATYDGAVMRVFINGQPAGERELADGVLQQTGNRALMVGYMHSGSRPFFEGDMNGIRISNKAFSNFPMK